jgi:predicted anti-sigma-YlaC factor YlaD
MEPAEAISTNRLASAGAAALLAVEALGAMLMWAPIPLGWLWIGGRVYAVTGSLMADGFVAFFGFVACVLIVVAILRRIDVVWIALRRSAGHDQKEGALSEVAAISGAFGIVGFLLWYYLLSHAYVIPFMPSSG